MVTSSADSAVYGQTVTFTATVSNSSGTAVPPTGTVTFEDGGSFIGTGVLSGGSATLADAALSIGTQAIAAVYSGDTNFSTSTAAPYSRSVSQAITTTTLTSSGNPSWYAAVLIQRRNQRSVSQHRRADWHHDLPGWKCCPDHGGGHF